MDEQDDPPRNNHGIAGPEEVTHSAKAKDPQHVFRPPGTVRIVAAVFGAALLILGVFLIIALIVLP